MLNLSKYKLLGEWTESTGGATTFAEKDGEKYFLKEYHSHICPSHEKVEKGIMTEKSYQKSRARFDRFLTLRSTVNERLNSIASKGGNIICPLEWGVVDGKFIEATEFVNNLIDDRSFIISLSDKEKIMILVTAIAALVSVHKKEIIHGDIKFKNIAVARKEVIYGGKITQNYVGKLIDFDCSFLGDNKPTSIGGDQVYMSPEVCNCWMTEMAPESIEKIDYKADIFSMGVLFHEYLTGRIPEMGTIPEELSGLSEDKIYYGEYLLYGGEPKVSELIRNPRLSALIKSMIQLEAEARPSAAEILRELKEIKNEMEKGKGTTAEKPLPKPPTGFDSPWEEHCISFVESVIAKMNFVGCKRIEVAGKKVYEFYRESGTSKRYTKEQLIMSGLAVASGAGFAEPKPVKKEDKAFEAPWEEHCIDFVEAELARMNYVGCKRIEVAGKKVYEFYRTTGISKRYTKEQLIMSGLAVAAGEKKEESKAEVTTSFEAPWEEHCIEFVESELARMNYVGCKRIEVAGKKVYEFYRENGVSKRYTNEQLLMSGLAKKI